MVVAHETTDINGDRVIVGSTVRVLGFQAGLFNSMPEDEISYVKSMLNEVLVVDEIDEYSIAWVWKSWPEGDDYCQMHGLGLEPHLMRLDIV